MHEDDLIYTFAKEYLIRASDLMSLLMPKTLGVGVGVKGLDGRYLLANKAMEALFGHTAEHITHLTDNDLFPSEVATRLQLSDQQIIDGAAAASDELDLSAKGGCKRCLWLKFPMTGPDGEILSIG